MRLTVLLFLTGCSTSFEYTIFPPETHTWNYQHVDLPETEIYHTDYFQLYPEKPVDILIFLDQSCSMVYNNYPMVDHLNSLPSMLDSYNLDYRIGVLSIDPELANLTTYQDDDWFEVGDSYQLFDYFLGAIPSNGWESGTDTLFTLLTDNFDDNRDFFRLGVPLQILMISDEHDSSTETTPLKMSQLLYEDKAKKGGDIFYSAIVNLPGNEFCSDLDDPAYGYIGWGYIQTAIMMQGSITDICADDWSTAYQTLAGMATYPDEDYNLSYRPEVDSIQVMIHDGDFTIVLDSSEWVYDAETNSVSLVDMELLPEETLEITYQELR